MGIKFTSDEDFANPPQMSTAESFEKSLSGAEHEFARRGLKSASKVVGRIQNPLGLPGIGIGGLSEEQEDSLLSKAGLNKNENPDILSRYAGRAGDIAGSGGFLNPMAAFLSSLTGQTLEEAGAPGWMQTLGEIGVNLRGAGRGQTAGPMGRIAQPNATNSPRNAAQMGRITQGKLDQQMTRINQEASELAQNIGSNHPKFNLISGAIRNQVPIMQNFQNFFRGLEGYAQVHNQPLQNVKPLDNFLNQELMQYANTGSPTAMSKFAMDEINGWQHQGKNDFYNMFRRYRLNNERSREIRANRDLPRDIRNQQLSFLSRMNEGISESFRQSLPPNHPWLEAFESSNQAYGAYQNTLQARRVLDPLLHGNMTDADATRFLDNPRIWEDIERLLGPAESTNLRQILNDVRTAKGALRGLKRFPQGWQAIMQAIKGPLAKSVGLGKLIPLLHAKEGWDWAVGRHYANPQFQGTFHQFTEALVDRNIPLTTHLIRVMANEKNEDKEEDGKDKNGVQFKAD